MSYERGDLLKLRNDEWVLRHGLHRIGDRSALLALFQDCAEALGYGPLMQSFFAKVHDFKTKEWK